MTMMMLLSFVILLWIARMLVIESRLTAKGVAPEYFCEVWARPVADNYRSNLVYSIRLHGF